jgi:hypothetical protein
MSQENITNKQPLIRYVNRQQMSWRAVDVGVAVTQEPNDSGQLLPAVDRLEQRLEKKPQQMVADSGYTTRENIEKMARREIDFLGTMRYENVPRGSMLPNQLPPSAFPYLPEKNHCVCPEGKVLHPAGQRKRGPGIIYHVYEARLEDCQACPRKPKCCPDNQKHAVRWRTPKKARW